MCLAFILILSTCSLDLLKIDFKNSATCFLILCLLSTNTFGIFHHGKPISRLAFINHKVSLLTLHQTVTS